MNYRHSFLLSTSRHQESPFSQSVIYLCEHSEQGAFGLVINKPLSMTLDQVIKNPTSPFFYQMPSVFWGGPVQSEDRGFVLHKHLGQYWKGTSQLASDLFLTTTNDILEDLISIPQDLYRVFVGYVYWQPNQLEYEISQDYWVLSDYKTSLLFLEQPEQLWIESYKHRGFVPEQMGCVDPGVLLQH